MKSAVIVVLTTVSNDEEAEALARKVVEVKLAACVQILPPMKSVYYWENSIQADSEHLLLIKTLREKFDELFASDASEVKAELNVLAGKVKVHLEQQFPDCTKVDFGVTAPAFATPPNKISSAIPPASQTAVYTRHGEVVGPATHASIQPKHHCRVLNTGDRRPLA